MTLCAACGLPGHRYGRNEGMERFDPIACINQLRGELEKRTLPGFIPCETCRGSGCADGIPQDSEWHNMGCDIPCRSCSGLGVVPDPETVEAVAAGLKVFDLGAHDNDWYRAQARTALHRYARTVSKESTRMKEPTRAFVVEERCEHGYAGEHRQILNGVVQDPTCPGGSRSELVVCGEAMEIKAATGDRWPTMCLQRPGHDGPHGGLVTWTDVGKRPT